MLVSSGASDGGGPDAGDGRKGKRELSTSKRAAQNRAAQVCRDYFPPLDPSTSRRDALYIANKKSHSMAVGCGGACGLLGFIVMPNVGNQLTNF